LARKIVCASQQWASVPKPKFAQVRRNCLSELRFREDIGKLYDSSVVLVQKFAPQKLRQGWERISEPDTGDDCESMPDFQTIVQTKQNPVRVEPGFGKYRS
jgi:hypothetical protein